MADRKKFRIAVASGDGIVVNKHFGRADTFYIYEADEFFDVEFVEVRKVTPVCNGGNHDEEQLFHNIRHLADCKYLLVDRIGNVAASVAESRGIIPMELPGIIEESIDKLTKYIKIQNLF